MLRALVFDVFSTLVHNEPHRWLATMEEVCRAQSLPLEGRVLWEQWRRVERSFREGRVNPREPEKSPPFRTYFQAWEEAFRITFRQLGVRGDPAGATRMAFQALGRRPAYADALEALPLLARRWRLAVLSNADWGFLRPALQGNGLDPFFEVVLCSEGIGAYKPHPRAFRAVVEALGLPPEEVAHIGDSPFDDVLGARLAGLTAVWVNRDGRPPDPDLPAPHLEVRTLADLPGILEPLGLPARET